MKKWETVDDVLEFAIGEEAGAEAFYTKLSEQAANSEMKQALLDFAKEEAGHKVKLMAIRADGALATAQTAVPDLNISDYLVDIVPTPDMRYADALVMAMKKEAAAYRMYTDLAAACTHEELKTALLALAQQEAKHKLRFEAEYDDSLTEN